MTAILAVRLKGQILMGSDRSWSNDSLRMTCGPKVLRLGDYVLALAGEHEVDWEALAAADPQSPSAVGALLGGSDAEAILVDRRRVLRYGCRGANGGWGWGAVKGAVAIGNGGPALLCAWDALHGYEPDPERRMRTALNSVAKRIPGVSAPFDLTWA